VLADPFGEFKQMQRESWVQYSRLGSGTQVPAAHLVRASRVRAGQHVLDVACGEGPVALTARALGAQVAGLDLTPELLAAAKQIASVAGYDDVVWREGDVEAMPFPDGEFDVVLSQFGHIFAPRAAEATKEMLRVLRPGGTLAFSAWDPVGHVGASFAVMGRYLPPLPPGMDGPLLWGDPTVVRERLGAAVKGLHFERGVMLHSALSPQHYVHELEQGLGPVIQLRQTLGRSDPAKYAQFLREYAAAVAEFFAENVVRLDYLIARATKV
jgi:SAM-dependent methyltransferase